jgi:hypothetical protein
MVDNHSLTYIGKMFNLLLSGAAAVLVHLCCGLSGKRGTHPRQSARGTHTIYFSVSDPDSLIPDLDPAFRLNINPDPGF